MKNVKIIFALLVFLQLGFSSCKKEESFKKGSSAVPQKFGNIKANKTFTWTTTRVVKMQYKSNLNDTRIAVLKVVDAKGIVYFKKLQPANQSFSGSIEVPNHVNTLKYVYGGFQNEFSAQVGTLNIELK